MLKKILPLTAVTSMALAGISPTMAQTGTFLSDFNFYKQDRPEVRAMAYLKISFTGGLKAKESPIRYGFALNTRTNRTTQDFQYSGFNKRYQMNGAINLLDLSFGPSGTESFKLNGFSFADMKALKGRHGYATGGEKGKTWPWIVGGIVIVGGLGFLGVRYALCDGRDKTFFKCAGDN